MKMSEEMAVRLHRMMWSDMQRELGDNPNGKERDQFKFDWIHKHFPSESIANDCWLCEYAVSVVKPGDSESYCKCCPISWPNCHCNTLDFSYAKESISEILALPAKNVANDDEKVVYSYYKFREDLLSKASGIPASSAIEDHVKAIVKKAVEGKDRQLKSDRDMMMLAYYNDKKKLSEASGLEDNCTTEEHIKTIQEKAVEEYFAKTPGAKLATMDVDEAFKQYADEQKAPIFRALAEASGLSAGNESVKAHISEISNKAKQNGRIEKCEDIYGALSEASGLSKGNWCLSEHVKAIQKKAKVPMESLRSANTLLAVTVNRYKNALSKESDLDRNRPVDDHIKKIVEDSFNEGRDYERERIMDKVGEMLNK